MHGIFLAGKKNCETTLRRLVILTLAIIPIGPDKFIKRIFINLRIQNLVRSINSSFSIMDTKLGEWIAAAVREVEKDLNLPANSLVDATRYPRISGQVLLKPLEVRLNKYFLADVPEEKINHSRELLLRKEIATRDALLEELFKSLRSLLE